ncbi:hypothetical protein A5792_10675 [Mycolicibacterium peregrinum]|uniref:Uncharacterized protein n=1 Tax=Mycolicibacterium peregrinum TaxID=43304 RepID=A0A1A0RHN1_MYCPR|nr:hypothetical protein A5792_10675 [Mycolicibacterium peregrinum]
MPQYSVVKETSTRYDNRPTYLVVIAPVSPDTDTFKQDVKGVVQDLASKNGPDFSTSIFDDQSVAVAESTDDRRARHLIAMYSGGLSTALYPYSISWFPASFTDTPTVGQWVDTEEWNPGVVSESPPATTEAIDPWKSMPNDGTFKMGGVDGKNWGVWKSDGARADDGCEWSIRVIDPNGPAIVLDEGTTGRNQNAQVAINPVKGANIVFVTNGCQPWSIVD